MCNHSRFTVNIVVVDATRFRIPIDHLYTSPLESYKINVRLSVCGKSETDDK